MLTGQTGDQLAAGAPARSFLTAGGLAETEELLEEIVTLAPLNRTPA